MNSVNLIGNMALDPELKKTNSGKDVCTIRIGVTRPYRNDSGERESDFINVQCWEQTARYVAEYLRKGDRIAVTGEFRERSYKAQDGQQRWTIEVLATRVENLSTGTKSAPAEEKKSALNRGFVPVDDSELPF